MKEKLSNTENKAKEKPTTTTPPTALLKHPSTSMTYQSTLETVPGIMEEMPRRCYFRKVTKLRHRTLPPKSAEKIQRSTAERAGGLVHIIVGLNRVWSKLMIVATGGSPEAVRSGRIVRNLPLPFGRNGVFSKLAGEDTELRLILVGKSGGGKSATGNTLLGQKEFKSLLEANTTTLRCQKGEGTWLERKIAVIDTPGLFDSKVYNEIVRREIMACVELSRPGPHALILVTQVGRFTAEDAVSAMCVRDIFGDESTKHTIVVFTCVEDLAGTPLQEYIQKSDNKNLREVIRRCGNRVCGFNNRAKGAERESQVTELMGIVQRTVAANGGRYYTNRLYQMSNIWDENVQQFLMANKTVREREAWRGWSRVKIMTVVFSILMLVAIVVLIVLLVRFL